MDPNPVKASALTLIASQSTLTLATAGKQGPWAAPVYYAYRKGRFYFFSNPTARHIQEAMESGAAGGAIHVPARSWKDIRGLQMSGRILEIGPGLEALEALGVYLGKYAFTREFFSQGEASDLEGFSKRFRVRLYAFAPSLVFYLDNAVRFGFREAVSLP